MSDLLCLRVSDCRGNFGGLLDVLQHVRKSFRRAPVVIMVMLVAAVVAACDDGGLQVPASSSTTVQPTTSTAVAVSSPTAPLPQRSGAVDLVRVDPATLQPSPGTAAVTSGDWISGTMSENGEWLVLNVWIDSEPDTDLIQVVEVSTGRVVTEFDGPLKHDLGVGDDGSVFHQSEGRAGSVSRLTPGPVSRERLKRCLMVSPDGGRLLSWASKRPGGWEHSRLIPVNRRPR